MDAEKVGTVHAAATLLREEPPQWRQVVEGFWAAGCDGSFLGTVDLAAGWFEARDAQGVLVSREATLRDAQIAVASPEGTAYRCRRAMHQVAGSVHRLRPAARIITRALTRLHHERITP